MASVIQFVKRSVLKWNRKIHTQIPCLSAMKLTSIGVELSTGRIFDTETWKTSGDGESPHHGPKVTVWCAISESKLCDPYFIKEIYVTVIVDANWYCRTLEEVMPKLDIVGAGVFFQQDRATFRTSSNSMILMWELFIRSLFSY